MRNKTKKKKDIDGREEVFLHVATDRNLRGRFRVWCKKQGMSMDKAVNNLMRIVTSENFHLNNNCTLSRRKKGEDNGE